MRTADRRESGSFVAIESRRVKVQQWTTETNLLGQTDMGYPSTCTRLSGKNHSFDFTWLNWENRDKRWQFLWGEIPLIESIENSVFAFIYPGRSRKLVTLFDVTELSHDVKTSPMIGKSKRQMSTNQMRRTIFHQTSKFAVLFCTL